MFGKKVDENDLEPALLCKGDIFGKTVIGIADCELKLNDYLFLNNKKFKIKKLSTLGNEECIVVNRGKNVAVDVGKDIKKFVVKQILSIDESSAPAPIDFDGEGPTNKYVVFYKINKRM